MLEEVGCDAVMIGRAALGNPWMIYRTEHYLRTKGRITTEPEPAEKIETAKLHLVRLANLKGEKVGAKRISSACDLLLKRDSASD